MDNETKKILIEEFRNYLETGTNFEEPQEKDDRHVDLLTLLSELVALKTEVKIEARQFKIALEGFNSTLETLTEEKSDLSTLIKQNQENNIKINKAQLGSLLLQLLELRDRIESGLKAAESYQPKWFPLGARKRERAVIQGLCDGQELTLRRLDQLLISYDVRPIDVLDQLLDPTTMRATEVVHIARVETGRVIGELRKGYYWGKEVMRIAEVKVNKAK